MNSRIYSGTVVHTRLHPVRHGFRTGLGFVALDLDELEQIDRRVRGFGINRAAPVSLREKNYLTAEDAGLREKLQPWLDKLNLQPPRGGITLITSPAWWGRVFNPVSFYLLRDGDGSPAGLIAEVNNTFGDRHVYPVRLEKKAGIDQAEHPKEFHVSPFNNREGAYRFTLREDGGELYIGVDLYRNGEKILESWIEGRGDELSTRSLWRHMLRHPLRPWLTTPKIVWQAVLLKYRRKLEVFKRPEPSHPHTLRSRHRPRGGKPAASAAAGR